MSTAVAAAASSASAASSSSSSAAALATSGINDKLTIVKAIEPPSVGLLAYQVTRSEQRMTAFVVTAGLCQSVSRLQQAAIHQLTLQAFPINNPFLFPLHHVSFPQLGEPHVLNTEALKANHKTYRNKLCAILTTDDILDAQWQPMSHFMNAKQKCDARSLLFCLHDALRAIRCLPEHLPHGLISPSYIFMLPSTTGVSLRIAGVGIFQCLSSGYRDMQLKQSTNCYYPSTLDLKSDAAILAADLHAVVRCMVDLASMKLSEVRLPNPVPQLRLIESMYTMEIRQLFTKLLESTDLAAMIRLVNLEIERNGWTQVKQEAAAAAQSTSALPIALLSVSAATASNQYSHTNSRVNQAVAALSASFPVPAVASSSSPSNVATSVMKFEPSAPVRMTKDDSIDLTDDADGDDEEQKGDDSIIDADGDSMMEAREERKLDEPLNASHRVICVYQGVSKSSITRQFMVDIDSSSSLSQGWMQLVNGINRHCGCTSWILADMRTLTPILEQQQRDAFIQRVHSPTSVVRLVLLVFDPATPKPLSVVHAYTDEINIQPHISAMLESGEYAKYSSEKKNFLPIAWSFGEYVDNSLSAMRANYSQSLPRHIRIDILDYADDTHLVFHDEGEGMDSEGLLSFGRFGFSRKARANTRDVEDQPNFLSGQIGEFGVGSAQASFFNADILSVMTSSQASPQVTYELEIDAEKLKKAEAEKAAEIWRAQSGGRPRGSAQSSRLNSVMTRRKAIGIIVKEETKLKQFTRIILSKLKPTRRSMIRGKWREIMNELVRIYRFYLFGMEGMLTGEGEMTNEQRFQAMLTRRLQDPEALRMSVRFWENDVITHDYPDISQLLIASPTQTLQFMTLRQGQLFCFQGRLEDPDTKLSTIYHASIAYYPVIDGEETHPEYPQLLAEAKEAAKRNEQQDDHQIEGASSSTRIGRRKVNADATFRPGSIFEISWHGRIIPDSTVNSFSFIDEGCSKKGLSACRHRLKGIIHFKDNELMKPSKNKLTLDHHDLSVFINQNSSYDYMVDPNSKPLRKPVKEFSKIFVDWLRDSHVRYDRELAVDEASLVTLPDGSLHYTRVNFQSGDDTITIQPNSIISFSQKKPHEYGKFIRYTFTDPAQMIGGTFHYTRIPEEKYGTECTKSVSFFRFVSNEELKQQYKADRKSELQSVPKILESHFTVQDGSKLIKSDQFSNMSAKPTRQSQQSEKLVLTAGAQFNEQLINVYADVEFGKNPLRSEKGGIRIVSRLRGILARMTTLEERQTKENRMRDKSQRDDFDFAPKFGSYISQDLGQTTTFPKFKLDRAGEYIIEWFIEGSTHIEKSITFVVQPGPVADITLDNPKKKTPTLQLGQSFQPTGIFLSFLDELKNQCPCDDLIHNYEYTVQPSGKGISAATRHLRIEVKLGIVPNQPLPPSSIAATSSAAAAAIVAPSLTPPAALSRFVSSGASLVPLTTLPPTRMELYLRISVAPGEALPGGLDDIALELHATRPIRVKRGGAFKSKPFQISLSGGAPSQLVWSGLHTDDGEMITVEHGQPLPDLAVLLCDAFSQPVAELDPPKLMGVRIVPSASSVHLITTWPNGILTPTLYPSGDLLLNGESRFVSSQIGVMPKYFSNYKTDRIDFQIECVMEIAGGVQLLTPALPVQMRANTIPLAIRATRAPIAKEVATVAAPGASAGLLSPRAKRSAAVAAAAAISGPASASSAAASSSSSATASAETPSSSSPPVTFSALNSVLSGQVASELPILLQVFDEANRSVSIAELKKHIQTFASTHPLETNEGATIANLLDADIATVMDEDNMSGMASVASSIISFASKSGRKRKLTTKAAGSLSAVGRRRLAATILSEESAIEVKGLEGVTSILVSQLGDDGIIHGVLIPKLIHAKKALLCSLQLKSPLGTLVSDFSVEARGGPPASLELKTNRSIAIDQPIGDAIQLIYTDEFGNIVDAPTAREEQRLVVEVVSDTEGAMPVEQECMNLSRLQLQSNGIGSHTINVTNVALKLSANILIRVVAGTPISLRFSSHSSDPSSVGLTFQATTRSILPPLYFFVCDKDGHTCTDVSGSIILKSSLIEREAYVPLTNGVGSIEKLKIRHSTFGVSKNIQVLFKSTPPPTTASSSGRSKSAVPAPRSLIELESQVDVFISATPQLIVGLEFVPLPADARLQAGSKWPNMHVRVIYEDPQIEPDETDLSKFRLKIVPHALGKSSSSRTAYTYPAPTLETVNGRRVLSFKCNEDLQVVRRPDVHQFVVTSNEDNPNLIEVINSTERKKQATTEMIATPGPPVRVNIIAKPIPGRQDGMATHRTIAQDIKLRFCDAHNNVISLQELPQAWQGHLKKPIIQVQPATSVGASSSSSAAAAAASSSTVLPELDRQAAKVDVHHDSVDIQMLRVTTKAPLGFYEIKLTFPGIDIEIDTIPFELNDNSELSIARTKLHQRRQVQEKTVSNIRGQMQQLQHQMNDLQKKLQQESQRPPVIKPGTRTMVTEEGPALLALIESIQQRASVQHHPVSLPRCLNNLTRADAEVLNSDPNCIGLLPNVVVPLTSEIDAELLSWHLHSRLDVFLFESANSPGFARMNAQGRGCFVLDRVTPPTRLEAHKQLAGLSGHPIYAAQLLLGKSENHRLIHSIWFICKYLVIVDTRADAEALFQFVKTRYGGKLPHSVLVRDTREYIGGGISRANDRAPSLAEMRQKGLGTLAVSSDATSNQYLTDLRAHAAALTQRDDWMHQLAHLTQEQAQLKQQLDAASSKVHRVNESLALMEKTKVVPPDIDAEGTESNQQIPTLASPRRSGRTNTQPTDAASAAGITVGAAPSTSASFSFFPYSSASAAASSSSSAAAPTQRQYPTDPRRR